MRKLICLLLIIITVLPAAAQTDLEESWVRVAYLNPDEPMFINVSAEAGTPYWFLIDGLPADAFIAEMFEVRGASLDIMVDQLNATVVIQAEASDEVNDVLKLTATGVGGYLRIAYQTAQPDVADVAQNHNQLGEPMETVFTETFDDNANGWWTGFAESSLTEVVNGVLQMGFSSPTKSISGFDRLPGTDSRNFQITASVEIGGTLDDTYTVGLMVRLVDAHNFYLFQVRQGAWRFIMLENSTWQLLTDWQADDRLNDLTGSHQLSIWAMGGIYVLMWDDAIVGHGADLDLQIGGAGVYAEVPQGSSATPILAWDSFQIDMSLNQETLPTIMQ